MWLIPITVNITDKSNYAPNGGLLYDSYPGGTFKVPVEMTSSSVDTWFYKFNVTATQQPYFGFVPTTSALDIGRGNVALTAADYTTKYTGATPPTGTKSSPFTNFITAFNSGSSANEEHLTIGSRNGDWIAAELNKASLGTGSLPVATNCTYMCGNVTISGPEQVCNTATYTIPNLPLGSTVTWSAANGCTISGSVNANPVTVVKTLNAAGIATLNATINFVCGTAVAAPKAIIVGLIPNTPNFFLSDVPVTNVILQYGGYSNSSSVNANVCVPYGTLKVISMSFGSVQNLQATSEYGASLINFSASGTATFAFNAGYRFCVVKVDYDLPCGHIMQHLVFNNTCYSPPLYPMSVSPNPANLTLTISQEPNLSPAQTNQNPYLANEIVESVPTFEVNLFNDKGKLILNQVSTPNSKDITLNTQNLPNGTYFLHIINEKETVKKQIIIQH